MGLLKKISATLAGSERYEARILDKTEFTLALEVRGRVFGELLKHWQGDKSLCPALETPLDAESTHLLCRDTRSGKPVGYLRLTPGHRFGAQADPPIKTALGQFPQSLHAFLSVWSLIALDGGDKEAVRASLFLAAYKTVLSESKAALIVAFCAPTDFGAFRVFGFRPLSRVVASALSGHTLPLFLDLHGYQSLKLLDSPFHAVAEAAGFPPGKIGSDWYRDFVFQNGSIDTGYTRYKASADTNEFHASLTEGLKESAKKQLLGNALHLHCRFGETVLAESAHDRSLGVVKKGALEVFVGSDLIAVLGEGDVFGELAFILGGGRKAEVKAASEGTEIVVLTPAEVSAIKSPADQLQFWKNLASLLAKRVLSANTALNDARSAKTIPGMPNISGS